MNITARLTKLEGLAGKNSCPYCRLTQRHPWSNPSRPDAKDRGPEVMQTCPLCGRRDAADLSNFPDDAIEIVRLCGASGFEATFTNPRAWVAWRWRLYRFTALGERQKVLREVARTSRPKMDNYERDRAAAARLEARLEREASPGYKLLQKLRKEAKAGLERRRKRVAAKHGDDPFPDLTARLEGAEFEGFDHLYRHEPFSWKVPFSEMYHTKAEAENLTKCAEAEKILLGNVAPSTAAKLAECELRAKEIVAATREKHEADEEIRRRKEEEQAQRYREMLERSRASAAAVVAAPPTPPSGAPPSRPKARMLNSNTIAVPQYNTSPRPCPRVASATLHLTTVAEIRTTWRTSSSAGVWVAPDAGIARGYLTCTRSPARLEESAC